MKRRSFRKTTVMTLLNVGSAIVKVAMYVLEAIAS